MLMVFSFWRGDKALAIKNLRYMARLGVGRNHEILLITPNAEVGKELALATDGFKKAHLSFVKENTTSWPFPSNHHFAQAVAIVESPQFKNQPFLWYEPDAVLLRATSLDDIETEYKGCRQPMMGGIVDTGEHHMNGVGVWLNVTANCPLALQCPAPFDHQEAATSPHQAFDFHSRHQHMPLCHESKLFQLDYRKENERTGEGADRWSFIKPETALLHTEKTGRLIDFLMASYGLVG